jgi:hypothetical protein
MRIRNPGWRKFGSGMEKSRIRDKHPGFAILVKSVGRSSNVSIVKRAGLLLRILGMQKVCRLIRFLRTYLWIVGM